MFGRQFNTIPAERPIAPPPSAGCQGLWHRCHVECFHKAHIPSGRLLALQTRRVARTSGRKRQRAGGTAAATSICGTGSDTCFRCSRLTVATILSAQPSWLTAGNGRFEAAIGAYVNEHDQHDQALEAFTRAAGYGSSDAGRLYAAAALLALGQGDAVQAEKLVRLAREHAVSVACRGSSGPPGVRHRPGRFRRE